MNDAVSPEKRNAVLAALRAEEEGRGVRVLFAAESGRRALAG